MPPAATAARRVPWPERAPPPPQPQPQLQSRLLPKPTLTLLFLLALLARRADAQFAYFTTLFNQSSAKATAILQAQLEDSADLWQVFYPNKYLLPTDYYSFLPPNRATEYTQNVIFNPCQGYEYNCCFDTYGTPEYVVVDSDPNSQTYGTRSNVLDTGAVIDPTTSRLPDDELFIDNSCTGVNLPAPRTDCVMSRIARRPFASLPRCWNRNDTVVADGSCRSPADGSLLPLCIELAVTQTNFIIECDNDFKTDPHCGTFLEVHRPGFADKIGEARLRAMYPSGYRTTVLSTTYKGDQTRTLCYDSIKKGKFELWWVQRTRYNFVVERRIPFSIISPECDCEYDRPRALA